MRKYTPIMILLFTTVLIISACGKASDPAAKVVESYFNALVNKDASALSALSCAEWEPNALLELDSLQAVSTRLENLSCVSGPSDGSTSEVNCQGKILATYNNEDQELDLSVRTYKVVQQGSEYLFCGYK
jgi:hypothetical protein